MTLTRQELKSLLALGSGVQAAMAVTLLIAPFQNEWSFLGLVMATACGASSLIMFLGA